MTLAHAPSSLLASARFFSCASSRSSPPPSTSSSSSSATTNSPMTRTTLSCSAARQRSAFPSEMRTKMIKAEGGRRRTTTTTTKLAALAFIPAQGVFARNEDDENDLIPNPTFKQLEKYCKGWTVGRERGADDDDHLCRRFRAKDAKAGHRILEVLQERLMTEEERGCRIRRETQEMYYMCCDGVRVRMNEGKGSVLVEIPIEENALLGQFKRKCKVIESIVEEQNKL